MPGRWTRAIRPHHQLGLAPRVRGRARIPTSRVKILTAPNVGVNTSVQRMRELYEAVGINVQLASTENLNLPDLNDVDVGKCQMGTTTDEQDDLFANRNNANADDICAYFVRSTVPPFNGCAAHPDNRPALVVAREPHSGRSPTRPGTC